jgi:NAD(P)-dependent dehydrogenase (short-subunit alcohol dehydrogenase family)
MKSVLVTGASTGIGWAICEILGRQGFRVFGSVRREEDAARLAQELGTTPLLLDVTDPESVTRAAEMLRTQLGAETLYALVNNAGIAIPGPLLHLPLEKFREQMAVNVTGPFIVNQAFAPLMGKGSRIVMMSSVGGVVGTPFLGAYNASKFAIEGMSEALRRELMLLEIDVIIIAPGAVATPIWGKGDTAEARAFAATPYGPSLRALGEFMKEADRTGLPPERIGELVHKVLTEAHPRTRYLVTPDLLRHLLLRWLPKRIADRLVAKTLGLLPKKN